MQTIYLHANAVYRQLLTEFHFHFRAVSESPRETRFLHAYDAIKQFLYMNRIAFNLNLKSLVQ